MYFNFFCSSYLKIAFKKMKKYNYGKTLEFLKKSKTAFQNSFFSTFFCLFLCLSLGWDTKKTIENRTPVNFCLHHEFYKSLYIFGHFCCCVAQFLIFLQFLSGVQKYVWKDVIHMSGNSQGVERSYLGHEIILYNTLL